MSDGSEGTYLPHASDDGGGGGSTAQTRVESRYFVRRHTWLGKSMRQLCITARGVVVLTPGSADVAAAVPYADILGAVPSPPPADDEFVLAVRVHGSLKPDRTTYSTPYRAQLLEDLALARAQHGSGSSNASSSSSSSSKGASKRSVPEFRACVLKRSGERRDVLLQVRPWGLCQVHPISGAAMATYAHHLVERVAVLPDADSAVLVRCGRADRRAHIFVAVQPSAPALVAALRQTAWDVAGVRLPVAPQCLQQQQQQQQPSQQQQQPQFTKAKLVLERQRGEEECAQNTLFEFQVLKHSPARHADAAPRILALSDRVLVERSAATYAVVTVRPLATVDHLVRARDDPQALRVVYRDGACAHYTTAARDALLACLLDCVRAGGGSDVFVAPEPVRRGLRMTPPGVCIDSTMEAEIIKGLALFDPGEYVYNRLQEQQQQQHQQQQHGQTQQQQEASAKEAATRYFGVLVDTFNANVPYSGPLHSEANKAQQRLVVQAVQSVAAHVRQPSAAAFQALRRLVAVRAAFEAFADNDALRARLLRLLRAGLQAPDELAVCAALDVADALMVPQFKLDSRTTDAANKAHILADGALLDALFALLGTHVRRGTSPLVVLGCVDVLTTMLCPPYGDTTPAAPFRALLARVAALGRDYFRLFHQGNCLSVVRGAGLIMKALIEEGGDTPELVAKMQRCALVEGATLRHLHAALYTKGATPRQRLVRDLSTQLVALWVSGCRPAEQMLARVLPPALVYYLESTDEPPVAAAETAEETAEKSSSAHAATAHGRTGLISSLLDQWRRPTFPKREAAELRPKQITWPGTRKNWAMLFYQIAQDHHRADLIWDNHTREELREALETELRVFKQEQELAADGFISWNHAEFIVPYECLRREVHVCGYYLRLLLNPPQPGQKAPVLRNPPEFFDMLFHRCLLEQDAELQALCVQALTVVYRYYGAAVGPFRDVAHLVALLRQCTDCVVRDRLLQLFAVLLAREDNAKLFVDHGGVQLLVDLLTLVHYDVDHVVAPLAGNLLTAGTEHAEGEWFYMVVTPAPASEKTADGTPPPPPKKERFGPKNIAEMEALYRSGAITPATLCWANGLEDWRPLGDIVQLRWRLMARCGDHNSISNSDDGSGSGMLHGVLSSVELAGLLLDMLTTLCRLYPIRDEDGGIIRPLPRPKRQLSGALLLPHVVQVLLTFEPVLVDKAAQLLSVLLEDNAAAVPKAYLTGVFYFCFLYAGSNVLPLVRLVKRLHLQQHFREDALGEGSAATAGLSAGDLARRSILGALLPPAMVHLLERKSVEEFAAVYLGNNDTPEAIWNHGMRRLLGDRIAAHVGTFLVRLAQNPRAIYQYVPIPPVVYDEIAPELFCCHYYLRNFCDTARFPMWPVDNEVEFLQALLVLWARQEEEIQRQEGGPPPPTSSSSTISADGVDGDEQQQQQQQRTRKMTMADALEQLGLKRDYSDDELRRAYFRLAKEYHPDKNPEGKAVFQRVTEAYALLSTHEDPEAERQRRLLTVRAQSILYVRFRKELAPFKYAGYPLLCATLRRALAADDRAMVHACTALCYRTLQATSLNAEELRRQGGLDILCDVLLAALARLYPDTRPGDVAAQTAADALLSFATAAAFDACRARIAELPPVPRCVCACLAQHSLPRVVEAALECACCFALDTALAADLTALGALYRALPLLFAYDPTLADAHVAVACDTAEPDAATPQLRNDLAQLALLALARLGGLLDASTGDAGAATTTDATGTTTGTTTASVDPERAACVRALLSPGIADLVGTQPAAAVLRTLTTSVETPLLIWNSACRAEVLAFVDAHIGADAQGSGSGDVEFDAAACRAFVYPTLARELQIGGVYVRVYNAQPAAQAALPDPAFFAQKLLAYIARSVAQYRSLQLPLDRLEALRAKYAKKGVQEQSSGGGGDNSSGDQDGASDINEETFWKSVESGLVKTRMAAEALRNLLRAVPATAALVRSAEAVRTVLSLAALDADAATQRCALAAVATLTQTREGVAAIADAHALAFLGPALCARRADVCTAALAALSSLLGSARVVGDCLAYGTLLHVLRVFAQPTERGGDIAPRTAAAAALAKMSADAVHGSRVQLALQRFVPAAFVASMRQDAEAAVYQFEGTHENPELVWNGDTRAQLRAALAAQSAALLAQHARAPDALWALPDDYRVHYAALDGELVLGGVFVRLFLAQPAWALRAPKAFLEALLTRFVDAYAQAARGEPDAPALLDTLLAALSALVAATPALADHAARTGHLAKIVGLLADPALPRQAAAAGVVDVLSGSALCVETLAATPGAVRALAAAVAADPRHALLPAVGALARALARNTCAGDTCCLVAQLLPAPEACTEEQDKKDEDEEGTGSEALDTFLDVLRGRYDAAAGADAAEAKAHVVTALQHAADDDARHGPALRALLDASPVWAGYRGMRHDLFLPGQQAVGLLTGSGGTGPGAGGSIGLLTNTPSTAQAMSDAPPELF